MHASNSPATTGEQLTMFTGRQDGGGVSVLQIGDRTITSSTTWMFRRTLMDDFKVRAACWNLEFKQRVTWNEEDADGDTLAWVVEYKQKAWDKEPHPYHVRGPDGEYLKEKWHGNRDLRRNTKTPKTGGFGPIVRHYDPPHEVFPSHRFPTCFPGRYKVTGDDGTTWEIGSRGNDLAILRQEVICNPELWPAEKDELLRWLDGPRKLVVEPGTPQGEGKAVADVICIVDHYFHDRICKGNPDTSEEEILASGLPDEIVENLLYNFQNYKRVLCSTTS